jgi:hypothetical protein
MYGTHRLSDAELAEMRRRRPAARVTLACEGMHLSREDETLLEEMDHDRLVPEDRIERVKEYILNKMRNKTLAAE